MVKAVDAIRSGRMGGTWCNRVAEEYNIPRTTLIDRLAGRVKHGTNQD